MRALRRPPAPTRVHATATPPYATNATDWAARAVRDARSTRPRTTRTTEAPPSTNQGSIPISRPETTKAPPTGMAAQATQRTPSAAAAR